MKILVTGGGGFLGQALCRGLVERGHDVASFNRGHYPELEELGVVQHRGDLADAAAVHGAAAGCDAVFHSAAKAGAWGPYEDYHRANVVGTGARGAQVPVLCVELAPGASRRHWPRIEAELRALDRGHVHTAGIDRFLRHPGFPVDIRHNAKIGREKLAAWAARQ